MVEVINVNGITLTAESIEIIRRLQKEGGIESHVRLIESLIDDVLSECKDDDPKTRLRKIQDLRYLEQNLLTFKRPEI